MVLKASTSMASERFDFDEIECPNGVEPDIGEIAKSLMRHTDFCTIIHLHDRMW